MQAPTLFHSFIIIKFKIKFTITPIVTDIVNSFCLLVGSKYCIPIIFDIPISRIIGDIILINTTTLSYPGPKNHGTKSLDIAISPNIIGKLNK